jgi:hypothetical protein
MMIALWTPAYEASNTGFQPFVRFILVFWTRLSTVLVVFLLTLDQVPVNSKFQTFISSLKYKK